MARGLKNISEEYKEVVSVLREYSDRWVKLVVDEIKATCNVEVRNKKVYDIVQGKVKSKNYENYFLLACNNLINRINLEKERASEAKRQLMGDAK